MDWTLDDRKAAQAEGWFIAIDLIEGPRIGVIEEEERFPSDAAAVAYVGFRASLGNLLARKAFEYLATRHGVEDAARSG